MTMADTTHKTIERGGYTLKLPLIESESKYGDNARVDKRGDVKRYGRRYVLSINTTDPNKAPTVELSYSAREAMQDRPLDAAQAVKAALKSYFIGGDVQVKDTAAYTLDRWDPVGPANPWRLTVELFIPADKPSKIIAPEEAHKLLGDTERLMDIILQQVAEVIENRAQAEVVAQDREDAQRLLGWIADQADKRARKVVRWEQRLAALKAELEAEQEAQVAELLEAGGDFEKAIHKSQEEEAEVFSPRAIQAARKAAQESKRALTPPLTRFLGTNYKISIEEITSQEG